MTQQDDNKITIQIASNKMEATLALKPGIDPGCLSGEVVMALVLSHAIQPNQEMKQVINQAIESYADHDFTQSETLRVIIAKGCPAIDGDDESFKLTPELQAIYEMSRRRVLTVEQAPSPEDKEAEPLDHRQRSKFMIVQLGQPIGKISPETDGVDGIDVCGNIIPAKPGISTNFKADLNSVESHADGTVYAKVAGRLLLAHDSVSISPTLELTGYVDFSTGNIDFPGNVSVLQGVRDGFLLQSGKTITVSGLVEAAELVAGRDISLKIGIAGRGKGSIFAGRDVQSTYLDACECRVGRDLIIENDINDCKVVVTRNVLSPSATLIGGELAVLGSCELAKTGTPSGTRSIITLGRVPEFDRMISEALKIISLCQTKAQDCINKLAELNADPDCSTTNAEMLTKLQFEASEHESKIEPLMDSIRAALAATKSSTPRLTVHKRLCQNTEIRAGGLSAVIQQDIEGPVEITLDDQGQFICKNLGDSTQVLLGLYATIDKADASFTDDDLPKELLKAA